MFIFLLLSSADDDTYAGGTGVRRATASSTRWSTWWTTCGPHTTHRTSPAAVSAASAAAPSTHSGTTSLARSPSLPAPPPSPPVAATSASPSSPAPACYSHTATPASSHALLLIPLTPYVISIIVFHSHRPCLNADINLSGFAFYLDG